MKKILVLFLIVVVLLSSCDVSSGHYICDYDSLTAIQIVRLDGVDAEEYKFECTIVCDVADVSLFVEKFQSLEQRKSNSIFGDPSVLQFGDIVFRFEYENGDEDIISPTVQSQTRLGVTSNEYVIFNKEEFYSFMSDCMQSCGNEKIYFMHSDVKISSMQIVNSKWENVRTHHTPLFDIHDFEAFANDLSEVDYQITNDFSNFCNWETPDKHLAVKITYENGDYEVFSHNRREEYRYEGDVYHPNVYIGTFDSEQFYALLSEYIEN